MANGRTAAITGSTGGIGTAIARGLAEDGWSLVLVNRSRTKALAQKEELQRDFPTIRIQTVQTDLMDLESIKTSCDEIAQITDHIDALYCVAGVLTSQRTLSAQGHESHYAVNVLAPYALIRNLAPLLTRAESDEHGMVVTMSSSAINRPKLDTSSLSDPAAIGGLMGAYAHTKLAMTAMCVQMAPELEESGVLIRAIDPGPTKTSMTSGGDGMPIVLRWLVPLLFADASTQAAKVIKAADPEGLDKRTGVFVSSGRIKPLPSSIAEAPERAKLMDTIASDYASS